MQQPMTDFYSHLRAGLQASIQTKQALLADDALLRQIVHTGELMTEAVRRGNRVIFAGNGGSAADAQHFAAEFVSRFEFDRPGLPSLSLATDTSMITAIGNDYGYEKPFSPPTRSPGARWRRLCRHHHVGPFQERAGCIRCLQGLAGHISGALRRRW